MTNAHVIFWKRFFIHTTNILQNAAVILRWNKSRWRENPRSRTVVDNYPLQNHFLGPKKYRHRFFPRLGSQIFSADFGHTRTSQKKRMAGHTRGLQLTTQLSDLLASIIFEAGIRHSRSLSWTKRMYIHRHVHQSCHVISLPSGPDDRRFGPGWPDWANFRLLSDSLPTLGSFFCDNYRSRTNNWAFVFNRKSYVLIITKMDWATLRGTFFYKRIWSPWFGPCQYVRVIWIGCLLRFDQQS
jgi:hypothetical protein